MWSIDVALASGCSPVILVVPPALVERARELVGEAEVVVTPGGSERQHSVGLGLRNVDTEFVVVHDAARPFVTPELFARVLAAVREADAVIAGMPVDETLKRVAGGHGPARSVVETIDREMVWRSQTPAAFKTAALKEAHDRAEGEGFVGTDESQLIERYGGRVKVVMGSRSNLKITFPDDFVVAEAMMKAMQK